MKPMEETEILKRAYLKLGHDLNNIESETYKRSYQIGDYQSYEPRQLPPTVKYIDSLFKLPSDSEVTITKYSKSITIDGIINKKDFSVSTLKFSVYLLPKKEYFDIEEVELSGTLKKSSWLKKSSKSITALKITLKPNLKIAGKVVKFAYSQDNLTRYLILDKYKNIHFDIPNIWYIENNLDIWNSYIWNSHRFQISKLTLDLQDKYVLKYNNLETEITEDELNNLNTSLKSPKENDIESLKGFLKINKNY